MKRSNGGKLRINRRSFQVLCLLVERAGQIVTKQDFFDTVWKDTFVSDNSLTVTMTTLRKVLGDDAKDAKFIENLPRKGYRFIGEVKIGGDEPPIVQVEEENIIAPTADVEEQNIIAPTANVGKKTVFGKRKVLFWISAACLMVLVVVLGFNYFGFSRLRGGSASTLQIESVAVLPFENQNPDTEYLSDGLTESVINSLSALSNLRVISRNSAFQYKNKPTDSMTVGRELNVNAVLTGRFSQHGDDLTINAELTDVRDNRQIWGRQYSRKASDEFALRQELARDVTEALRSKLTGEQRQRLARGDTDDPEAFRLYLKGRYYWNKRTNEGFEKAVEFFNQALEKDSTYALAYVGLANCYLSGDFNYTNTTPKRVAMVQAAVQKALEIDDTLGEAYAVLAINKCYYEWDFAGAERDYKRAIELSPNYATAHHWYADFLAMEGRFDESFAEYNRALELDPLSLAINTDLGLTYYYARQPDVAINHLKKLKEIDSNYARTYLYLGQIYKGENMFEESIAASNNYSTLTGDDLRLPIVKRETLADAFKKSGAKGYWKKLLEFALDNEKFDAVQTAAIFGQLGERDKAFEFLEKAYNERSTNILWLKVSPEFDNLRSDPRYADLVRRVGLPL
ncbi:MAG: winged helix-turn-helix domain-containing protein [Acidobacteriota bacterium]